MRAVWMREYGPPDVLVAGDAPDPVPGPGQALVEVVFSADREVVTFREERSAMWTSWSDPRDRPSCGPS